MESTDVFERTEEWARTIRAALDAPPTAAIPAAVDGDDDDDDPESAQTPVETPAVTPSRTRIVVKTESVTEASVATLESIHTPSTLTTLESTFEATLHARAMRAAGAGVGSGGAMTAAHKASAAFALGRAYVDYDDDAARRRERLRDSMTNRSAVPESSRRRRRWENDHLRDVPNAQLPLPSDWLARPTHPVHLNVPYHVAQYWDRGLCRHVNETRAAAAVVRRNQLVAQQAGLAVDKLARRATAKNSSRPKSKPSVPRGPASVISVATSDTGSEFSTFHVSASTVGQVTRQLRAAAKRTPAVKLWVRALEVPIRQYVVAESARVPDLPESIDGGDAGGSEFSVHSDSEDDEVVFIGRRILEQRTESWKRCPTVRSSADLTTATADDDDDDDDDDDAASDTTISPTGEGIVFDNLGEGARGSFKRWLAHSLADYYGLTSTSSTVDSESENKPANRVVYVALRDDAAAGPILIPRPMWELFDQ